VKRILLTGMSGTGKSTVIVELAARGYRAIDMDDPGWSKHAPDGDWIWRENRVQEALAREDGDVRFVSGCATNQGRFYPQFDAIVLFSAPAELVIARLATRTNNPYGKHPDELAAVLGYRETVEPRLRRSATHAINTRAPLNAVVAAVLRLTGVPERCAGRIDAMGRPLGS